MKQLVSATLLATCFLAVSPVIQAQSCSNWSNWDLRGTYTLSGHGYIDLSRAFAGMGLPSGWTPAFWVGIQTLDGKGGGAGWISFNYGGNQLTADFVGYTYSMQADCSVQASFRLKFRELGTTSAPQTRLGVVIPRPNGESDLEIDSLGVGPALGTPAAPSCNVDVKRRISMQ